VFISRIGGVWLPWQPRRLHRPTLWFFAKSGRMIAHEAQIV
jgi:hypothetical protein